MKSKDSDQTSDASILKLLSDLVGKRQSRARLAFATLKTIMHVRDIAYCVASTSNSWLLRDDVAEELGSKPDTRGVHLLIRLLHDPYYVVRCTAASSLAHVLGLASFHVLRKRLRIEHNSLVRRYIYVAIYDSGAHEGRTFISSQLEKEQSPVAKVGLLYCLALDGDMECLAELQRYKKHIDPSISHFARESLLDVSSVG